jgi:penicillin-binding protein 1A
VVGVYLGYDKPRHLGRDATGGHLAAPVAKEFFKDALAGKPATQFQPPIGIKLIPVDAKTGQRPGPGSKVITEAFKPGTAPPDNYVSAANSPDTITPDVDGAVRRGGLY